MSSSRTRMRVVLVDAMQVFYRSHFALTNGSYANGGLSHNGVSTAGLMGLTKTLLSY
jgi:hypothetical protein